MPRYLGATSGLLSLLSSFDQGEMDAMMLHCESGVLCGCDGDFGKTIVTVIGPGAGVGANRVVYDSLGRWSSGIVVRFKGRSGAMYDAYPQTWPNGRKAPNLSSFGDSLVSSNIAGRSQCLVFGSRGGQVCLPHLWRAHGNQMPPAVCINGGCSMGTLPDKGWQHWPEAAVTFMLMGHQDYFSNGMSAEDHLRDAMSHVPAENRSTAILYVDQMQHMPQSPLLQAVLRRMIFASLAWESNIEEAPEEELLEVVNALAGGVWTGRLVFKNGPGDRWQEITFGTTMTRRVMDVRAQMRSGNKKNARPAPQAQAKAPVMAPAKAPVMAPAKAPVMDPAAVKQSPFGSEEDDDDDDESTEEPEESDDEEADDGLVEIEDFGALGTCQLFANKGFWPFNLLG